MIICVDLMCVIKLIIVLLDLDLSDKTPEGRENIRLVVAAPTMYKFLAKLLKNEDFLHNPVQIALTAQKILMRIEGELNEVEK